MTRKDYEAFATLVREVKMSRYIGRGSEAEIVLTKCVQGMADVFAQDNSRFDRNKFYAACTLHEER